MFKPVSHVLMVLLLTFCPVTGLVPVASAEITKSQAASRAKANYGGKVLNVKKVGQKNGKSIYNVKLLMKDGRVKTVTISG